MVEVFVTSIVDVTVTAFVRVYVTVVGTTLMVRVVSPALIVVGVGQYIDVANNELLTDVVTDLVVYVVATPCSVTTCRSY